MSNDTAKTVTTNIVPVQGTFEPLPPYECIDLIGPAGTPFFAPVNPDLDGVSITNSTINSTTIGQTVPAAAQFTTATQQNQPIGNNDLTTKLYVDSLALGISWKQPVNAATIGNITLSGTQTIDGVAVVAGDRVLVKSQAAPAENGIYVATAGAWSRSPDADNWDELVSALVFVESGGLAGSAWYCPIQPGGTLGVTAITWNNFSVGGVYFAGTGLNLSGGDTFNIAETGVGEGAYGDSSKTLLATVNPQGQLLDMSEVTIAIGATQITSGTIDSARLSGTYSGITGVGTLTDLTVSNVISGSISGNAATATSATSATTATNLAGGAAGSVPYQTSAGTTAMLASGSNNQVLTLVSGFPAWANEQYQGDVVGPASSVDTQIARFDGTTGKVINTASVTISDAGAVGNVNEINFDVTPSGVVGGEGSLSWNSDDNTQTLDLVGAGGNVTMALGQETYYRVRASANISKGQVVMFTGTVGASGGLTAAPATGLTAATSQYVMGIAAETFANNNWGYITAFGEVRGFNTTGGGESWVNGQILYLNPSVAGGLTKTVPAAPAAKVEVCAVVYANANGSVFVRPTFFASLNQLNDVSAPTPSDNDLIVWDAGDARWENRAPSTVTAGKATSLAGGAAGSLPYQSAADTTTFLAAGTDGQVLKLASGLPTWSSDAVGITIADDTTTNATRYLTFTDATTGTESGLDVSSTKLQFNPSTGVLTSTSFTGAATGLTGTASININGTVGATTANTGAFTTLSATGVTTVQAGTVSAPAITTSGDTNTGIFFPAADTIAFSEGGVESMRIDSSGNVGIGTSSPAVSGLEIARATGTASPTPAELRISTTSTASDWSTTDPWGRLSFYSADTSSAGPKIVSAIDVTAEAASGGTGSISFKLAATTTGTLTERARIDSDGNLLLGTTSSASPLYNLQVVGRSYCISSTGGAVIEAENTNATASSGYVIDCDRTTSDGGLISFRQAGTVEGSISVSGTTVSYNGGHLSRWAQTTAAKDESLVKGTVLSNLDEMNVYTDAEGSLVQNEQLNKVKVSDVEGDANVAGVFVNWEHDDAHDVDEINMAMTGDMIIRIAQGVTVQRGDLLMSAGDGTAKPQGDDTVRSKTVAKVTSTHVTCTYADGSFCVPCVLMAC